MQNDSADGSSGYWYPESAPTSVDVLNLLRRYRAAEAAMRARTRASMKMNETDLLALRYLMKAQREGRQVVGRELAQVLEISSASTTALVDRLERSGHVKRVPHPTDRRAVHIEVTGDSDEEVRSTLGAMHQRMIATVDELSPADLDAVARFLRGMIASVEERPDADVELQRMIDDQRADDARDGSTATA